MAAEMYAAFPEQMLDEVWMVMNKVVQQAAHQQNKTAVSADLRLKGRAHCVLNEYLSDPYDDDFVEDEQGGFECEAIDDDDDSKDQEQKYTEVAEQLTHIGDTYRDEHSIQAQKELEQEIIDYIRSKGHKITEEYESQLPSLRPQDFIFQTGVLGATYSYFRNQLGSFVKGEDKSLNKIAVVSHVLKGVAAGLEEMLPSSVHVVAALGFKFITDEYGGFLKGKGGLVNLVETECS